MVQHEKVRPTTSGAKYRYFNQLWLFLNINLKFKLHEKIHENPICFGICQRVVEWQQMPHYKKFASCTFRS